MDYKKQTTIFNPWTDEQPTIHVVGAGALGSWLVLGLLKLGFAEVTVWDGDRVEEHNLPNQLYSTKEIGRYKVTALQDFIEVNYPEYFWNLQVRQEFITRDNVHELKGIVFNCVDTMQARKLIYKIGYKKGDIDVLIDDRLSIHGCYIYTLNKNAKRGREGDENLYERTLYDDTEAEVSECGVEQTIVSSAFFTSSLMLDILLSLIKDKPYMKVCEVEMHSLVCQRNYLNLS